MTVFLLQHSYEYGDALEHQETKVIGIYSSKEMAENAVEKFLSLPGFNKYPVDCFYIDKYTLDEDNWTEGFICSTEDFQLFINLTEHFNKWLVIKKTAEESWEDDNYYNALCEVSEKVYKAKNAQELANHIYLVWSVRFKDAPKAIDDCLVVATEVINSLKLI